MTATTAAPTTSESRSPQQIWQRVRGLLLAVLILVVAGVTFAALRPGGQHGPLDPRSADPDGSRALAELLEDRGVSVDIATTLDEATDAAGPDTTLLVTGPNTLTAHQQQRLRAATADSAGRTVLIAPGGPSVARLAPGVHQAAHGPVTARLPRCALPAARTAGSADLGGIHYATDTSGAIACYPDNGLASLLVLPGQAAGDTVLLGSPGLLHNDRLDQQGNASLGLQLLGFRPHLLWYLPSLDDPSAAEGGTAGPGDDTEGGAEGESGFIGLIPRAGSGPLFNWPSPPPSPPSGADAASAPWSPSGFPSPSEPPNPPKDEPASTAGPTPATTPRPPCAPPRGTASRPSSVCHPVTPIPPPYSFPPSPHASAIRAATPAPSSSAPRRPMTPRWSF